MRGMEYMVRNIVMFIIQSKTNIFFTLALIVAINFYIANHQEENRNYSAQNFRLKSKCRCRPNIFIKKIENNKYFINKKYYIEAYFENNFHNPDYADYQNYLENYKYTCNMYNVLRRGPSQRVISFSIFGSNANNYKPLLVLAEAIKKYYPGWIIRVYHDSNISQSVACEYECKEDIIDFCNVEQMPIVHHNKLSNYKASYSHAMMWRWYPLGDDFVDYFMSRDSDSIVIEREKDSVDVWLYNKIDTLFHIMRDHPAHNVQMLGMFLILTFSVFISFLKVECGVMLMKGIEL